MYEWLQYKVEQNWGWIIISLCLKVYGLTAWYSIQLCSWLENLLEFLYHISLSNLSHICKYPLIFDCTWLVNNINVFPALNFKFRTSYYLFGCSWINKQSTQTQPNNKINMLWWIRLLNWFIINTYNMTHMTPGLEQLVLISYVNWLTL